MQKLKTAPEAPPLTEDLFLGGRLRLRQPCAGARSGADAVMLAAAVPAAAGERIIELGSGSGAAALALAARVAGAEVVGVEIEPELAELARTNAAANGLSTRVSIRTGDIAELFADFPQGSFDHALANPPFFEAKRVAPPRDSRRHRARVGTTEELDLWLRFAAHALRPRGSLTVIWRAERLPELLSGLRGRFGGVGLFPLWPRAGRPAKLVIVRGRKGIRAPFRLEAGLVLHEGGARYTAEAEAILRYGAALDAEPGSGAQSGRTACGKPQREPGAAAALPPRHRLDTSV